MISGPGRLLDAGQLQRIVQIGMDLGELLAHLCGTLFLRHGGAVAAFDRCDLRLQRTGASTTASDVTGDTVVSRHGVQATHFVI